MDKQDELRKIADLYDTKHTFTKGDIVEWKPGLKNKRRPKYGDPVVVVEVLDEPISDKDARSDSAYFMEKLDIRLGSIDEDGDFVTYLYDSRRFMPFNK